MFRREREALEMHDATNPLPAESLLTRISKPVGGQAVNPKDAVVSGRGEGQESQGITREIVIYVWYVLLQRHSLLLLLLFPSHS